MKFNIMVALHELKDWANDLKPVLFDINLSVNNLYILRHDNSNNFKDKYNEVYLNLWYQQHFILIIQLAKLFSNTGNQKRNFIKLFNRFKNETFDSEINKILLDNKPKLTDVLKSRIEILTAVKELEKELEFMNEIMNKVIVLRDKVFAHTDINSPEVYITMSEFSNLRELANKIYNTLFGKIFDEYFHFQLTKEYDIRVIIEAFI